MFFSLIKQIIFLCTIFYCIPIQAQSILPSDSDKKVPSEVQMTFKDENEKLSYSLGVSLGNYVNQSFEKQQKIGITLNKIHLLRGIQDSIFNNLKMSKKEILLSLKKLEDKLNQANKVQIKKNIKENLLKGNLYIKDMSEKEGVIKTDSGLLYIIEKEGDGEQIKDNSKITLHYKGSLIDGTEFDNSYTRKKPISIVLKDVILGWQEGLKYIKKGGKIKLIIPPHLGYGTREVNGIPGNSVLIFDIELLNVVHE